MPNELQDYIYQTIVTVDDGTISGFTDPAPPVGLGAALTQAQIDKLKILLNEIENRFATGGGGGA